MNRRLSLYQYIQNFVEGLLNFLRINVNRVAIFVSGCFAVGLLVLLYGAFNLGSAGQIFPGQDHVDDVVVYCARFEGVRITPFLQKTWTDFAHQGVVFDTSITSKTEAMPNQSADYCGSDGYGDGLPAAKTAVDKVHTFDSVISRIERIERNMHFMQIAIIGLISFAVGFSFVVLLGW